MVRAHVLAYTHHIVMPFFHHPRDFDSCPHFLLSKRDVLTPKEGSKTALQREDDNQWGLLQMIPKDMVGLACLARLRLK